MVALTAAWPSGMLGTVRVKGGKRMERSMKSESAMKDESADGDSVELDGRRGAAPGLGIGACMPAGRFEFEAEMHGLGWDGDGIRTIRCVADWTALTPGGGTGTCGCVDECGRRRGCGEKAAFAKVRFRISGDVRIRKTVRMRRFAVEAMFLGSEKCSVVITHIMESMLFGMRDVRVVDSWGCPQPNLPGGRRR